MGNGKIIDDIAGIREALNRCRRIAVVGLSDNWYRPSYFAAKYMQEHGYTIVPVNPRYDHVLGERCYPSLDDIPDPVDMVDIFQRSEAVPPFVEQAIAIGARLVWMQLGVVNETAAARATAAGLDVIMDRCVKIEHARLLGGLNLIGVTTGVVSSRRPNWFPH